VDASLQEHDGNNIITANVVTSSTSSSVALTTAVGAGDNTLTVNVETPNIGTFTDALSAGDGDNSLTLNYENPTSGTLNITGGFGSGNNSVSLHDTDLGQVTYDSAVYTMGSGSSIALQYEQASNDRVDLNLGNGHHAECERC